MTRAALYLRQSQDRDRTELGIDRQRSRCTSLAEARGWSVVKVYEDNDISASRPRGAGTAWARLLTDAAAGRFDVVIASDLDRLLRTLRDLVTLTDAGAGVVTVDGELDLSTAMGEFRATMEAGLARFEARRKSERHRRANAQRRELGIPAGHRAPFGYRWVAAAERARRGSHAAFEPHPAEAAEVRRLYADVLAGAGVLSLSRRLRDENFRTAKTRRHPDGGTWAPTSVRRMLLSPFYAGLLPDPTGLPIGRDGKAVYRTDLVDPDRCTPGAWEALVSRETWTAARTLLLAPDRLTHSGNVRTYLLSGLATCSECGRLVRAGGRGNGQGIYRCVLGHFARSAAPIDAFVLEVLLARLAQPDAIAALQAPGEDLTPLRDERRAIEQRAAAVAGLVGDGTFTPEQARATMADLKARLEGIDAQLAEAVRPDVLADLPAEASADALAAWWDALALEQRRVVIASLVTISLAPVGRGQRGTAMVPSTVRIAWKSAA